MSAFAHFADSRRTSLEVREVPTSDICSAANCSLFDHLVSARLAIQCRRRRQLAPTNASQTALRFNHAKRAHCDLGGITAGPVQSFGRISTTNKRSGRFVLFPPACAIFPVS